MGQNCETTRPDIPEIAFGVYNKSNYNFVGNGLWNKGNPIRQNIFSIHEGEKATNSRTPTIMTIVDYKGDDVKLVWKENSFQVYDG